MTLRVVVVTETPRGGAGIAARRSQLALRGLGVDARFLARRDPPVGDDVIAVPPQALVPGPDGAPLPRPYDRRMALYARYPNRRTDIEMFSDAFGDLDLARIPEIAAADVVHLHWIGGIVDMAAAALALAGKRVFWTLHDANPVTGGCHYLLECRKFIERCGACPQLGSTNALDATRTFWRRKERFYSAVRPWLAAPSRWLAGLAEASPLLVDKPVAVLPNCLPTDVFRPYPRDAVRQALEIPLDAPLLLCGAGYDVPRKGFALLALALARLPELVGRPVHVAAFGARPQLPPDFPAGQFHDLGRFDDPTLLAAAYSAADCFAVPSLEDNLPNVVIEAMACGVPVAGFAVGGIPDMVLPGQTGALAAPGDADDLARAMAWVLTHPDPDRLRRASRSRALAEYAPEVHGRRLLAWYGERGGAGEAG